MAELVVVDKEQLESDLTTVADAIRSKGGTTEQLAFPQGMADAVGAIETGITPSGTIQITENGMYDVIEYVNAEVNVASGGSDDFVGIKYSDFDSYRGSPKKADASSLPDETSNSNSRYGGYNCLFANATKNGNGGWNVLLEEIHVPKLYVVANQMFDRCSNLKSLYGDFSNVGNVQSFAFRECLSLTEVPYMPLIDNIYQNAFNGCTGLTEFKFYKTPTGTIHATSFSGCTNITDIYVPWSEGEVANAPWGATNATIHYNTTYDENHNPIV